MSGLACTAGRAYPRASTGHRPEVTLRRRPWASTPPGPVKMERQWPTAPPRPPPRARQPERGGARHSEGPRRRGPTSPDRLQSGSDRAGQRRHHVGGDRPGPGPRHLGRTRTGGDRGQPPGPEPRRPTRPRRPRRRWRPIPVWSGPSRRSPAATTDASSPSPGPRTARWGAGAGHVLADLGVETAAGAELHMATAAGSRVVCVAAEVPGPLSMTTAAPTTATGAGGDPGRGAFTLTPNPAAEWQDGLERLADPASTPRFLTSRLLYRRFARFAWWLLVPFVIAIALRFPFVSSGLDHLVFGHPTPSRAIERAQAAAWGRACSSPPWCASPSSSSSPWCSASWPERRGGPWAAASSTACSRTRWPSAGSTANDDGRDAARALCGEGYAGLVCGATLQAELTHLGPGFFACPGAAGEIVEEHHGRLGLLPVFLACQQLAWVELETGAELHVRLLLTRSELPGATLLERAAARDRKVHDAHPLVVAAYPHGASWPPAPDLGVVRNRSRRVRRWAAGAIAVAGVIDVLTAVTPPLRGNLHLVLELLPFVASQAAGALVTLVGIGLLALARRGAARPAPGLRHRRVGPRRERRPAPGARRGRRWIAVLTDRARFPGREPPGVPGRVGPALPALGGRRPRRRRHRDHRRHDGRGGADAALRPRPAPHARCGVPGRRCSNASSG